VTKSHARCNRIALQSGTHRHSFSQILLGRNGALNCDFDKTGGRIGRGVMAWVPQANQHDFEGLNPECELLVLDLANNDPYLNALLDTWSVSLDDIRYQSPDICRLPNQMVPMIDFIADELAQDTSPVRAQRLSTMLLPWLGEVFSTEVANQSGLSRFDVARLNDFIDRQISQPISNDMLAVALHCSPSHLYVLCQQHLGCSPQAYITQRRLALAQKMLVQTRLPLDAIAQDTGFSDASSLSRACKRHFQKTPGQIRKQGM